MKTARNSFAAYNKSGPIDTNKANALIFINEGVVTFLVNNMVSVRPGDFFSISQVSADVEDKTEYNISFSLTHGSTTGTLQNCVVVKVGVYQNINTNC